MATGDATKRRAVRGMSGPVIVKVYYGHPDDISTLADIPGVVIIRDADELEDALDAIGTDPAALSGIRSMRYVNETSQGVPILRIYQNPIYDDEYHAVTRDPAAPNDLVWGRYYHPDEGYWGNGYYGCSPEDIEDYARGMRLVVDNGPLTSGSGGTSRKTSGTSKTASKSRKTSAAKRSAGASKSKTDKVPAPKTATRTSAKRSTTKKSTAKTTQRRR